VTRGSTARKARHDKRTDSRTGISPLLSEGFKRTFFFHGMGNRFFIKTVGRRSKEHQPCRGGKPRDAQDSLSLVVISCIMYFRVTTLFYFGALATTRHQLASSPSSSSHKRTTLSHPVVKSHDRARGGSETAGGASKRAKPTPSISRGFMFAMSCVCCIVYLTSTLADIIDSIDAL
jgi:hypothetical protein